MPVLNASWAALAWLGRQGARAIAAVVFIAIVVPPFDAVVKPFVTEAIFALLCLAFLRVDTAVLKSHIRRPGLVLAATAWTSLAVPALIGTVCLAIHLDSRAPALFLALMLQAVASPMMASPAFAAVMGLDSTLVLTTLVLSTALTPLSAPLFAYAFIGPVLTLSPLALGLKLFAILAGSLAAAAIIRRFASRAAIRRCNDQINGMNILLVFIFVAAVMENVGRRFIDDPLGMVALTALAFALTFAILVLTAFVFAATGRERALVLGLMASQRNMGLMLAATGGALPDFTWIYFALAQFPVYLSPLLLAPLARWVRADAEKQT
ncbi:MAG TPA: Na+-dependent transporter [Xanthobacteraceae bacterium]|nr:Na+-dependent transporter [Xanthobacteraceae bacterium]